jgi:pyruvate dehydrogenase E2 component (dihydrolipoamide acetyltransferase)
MEESAFSIPHVSHHELLDAKALVEAREALKPHAQQQGIQLTYLPFVMRAAAAALKEYPYVNASLDEEAEEIVLKGEYNIGFAVATDDGLLVPNIKDADQKSILEIAGEIEELAEKARNRELSLDQMRGGTFTITNWGSIGGKYGTPIINYPEVGILGTGVIEDEPRVVDGDLHVRKVMPLSLSFDFKEVADCSGIRAVGIEPCCEFFGTGYILPVDERVAVRLF